ncbi:MAG: amino acid ABC transporter permease [Deltaproteobacteria bacterium]|jgi:polar amino acid transport system permease protein|nr:amino acid ABC transporter permease [Deltaproteobacteria bacterium]
METLTAALFSPETLAQLADFTRSALFVAKGSGYTVALILGAMVLGLALGLPLSTIDVYGQGWLRQLTRLYVWFFRGVPILVLMFLIYFGVFDLVEDLVFKLLATRINLSPFLASVLALGLASAAYQSQIFKGAIKSLPVGQFQAARSLGFTRRATILHVILPQALRLSIPAWSNEYSILLKDSAVAFVLGTMEIMSRTRFMASTSLAHIRFYILAGLLYYILTWLGVKALARLEKKIRIPGLGHEAYSTEDHEPLKRAKS